LQNDERKYNIGSLTTLR